MLDFTDLDLGYEQVVHIHHLISGEGVAIAQRINTNIDKLTDDWVSEDATVQINNLINVYNKLVQFIKTSTVVLSEATQRVVEVMELRVDNGSKGSFVGGNVSEDTDLSGDKSTITTSSSYTTDVNVLKQDFEQLKSLTEEFDSFSNKVNEESHALLGDSAEDSSANWRSGNHRKETADQMAEFKKIASEGIEKLTEACEMLKIAITNIESVSE